MDRLRTCFRAALAVVLAVGLMPGLAYAEPEGFAEGVAAAASGAEAIGEAATIDDVGGDDELVADQLEGDEPASVEYGADTIIDAVAPDAGASSDGDVSLLATTIASGTCGDSLSWQLSSDYVLTISGSGAMSDFSYSTSNPSYPGWSDYASSIKTLVVSEGVTSVGVQAFYSCTSLQSAQLSSTLTSIGSGAFFQCYSLQSVNLPAGVTTISSGAFADCTSLTSVDLSNVQSLESYAFQGAPLGEVTIPASLTSIGDYAFYKAGVTAFHVASGNSVYSSRDGVLYTDGGTTLLLYPCGSASTSFTIPSGVTAVAEGAFLGAANIVSIDLGSAVSLGRSAFQEATALTSVTIPDSVTEVGYFTFYGCTSLQSVAFGNGLTETAYQMFRECTALTDIDFGTTLSSIYAQTFYGCTGIKSLSLPETITQLGTGAFYRCTSMTSLTTANLTSIPYAAFMQCSALTDVQLNEGVTEVNRAAFYYCRSLSDVTLPASVSYVHSLAFPTSTAITCLDADMRPYGQNGYRHIEDVTVSGELDYSKAYEVLDQVNAQRAANGLSALAMDESLLETAMQRATETSLLFSHTRPDGSSCFDANSAMSGENVSVGQATASAVMDSWMNSSGHKANILGSSYTTIGIGCFVHNGVTYWVQCFGIGSASSSCAQPANTSTAATVSIATEEFTEAATGVGTIYGTPESFEYTFSLSLTSTSIGVGDTTQGTVYVTNPGFTSARAKLDNVGIVWSTSNDKILAVNGSTATGVSSGAARVVASLQYYSAYRSVDVSGGATYFTDVASSAWYYESVYYARDYGLMQGYEGTTLFGPEDTLTRAQAAVILWRYFAPDQAAMYDEESSWPANGTGMADVEDNAWYTAAANWAVDAQVVNGVEDRETGARTFDPNGTITREQLCAIVANAAEKLCGVSVEDADTTRLDAMPDAAQVSDWAQNSVAWGLNKGVISGYEIDGVRYVQPGTAVQRSVMAAVMMNAIENGVLSR